jgi:hypothetical protein
VEDAVEKDSIISIPQLVNRDNWPLKVWEGEHVTFNCSATLSLFYGGIVWSFKHTEPFQHLDQLSLLFKSCCACNVSFRLLLAYLCVSTNVILIIFKLMSE